VPGIGPMELIVVLIVALLIFGPKKLPELGKSLGSGMRSFKDSVSGSDRDELPAGEPSAAEKS
jgi:sec-independent protein translocase protein TatA